MQVKRGVKQGDPLSPLLFNLVLDPLLRALEKEGGGIEIDGVTVPVLAFADDLVVLASSNVELQRSLDLIVGFLRDVGLELAGGKCGVMGVAKVNKTWAPEVVDVYVEGEAIRNYGVNEVVRYLGASFSVAGGLCVERGMAEVGESVGRVSRLALKPRQKLELLISYVLPGFYHLFPPKLPGGGKLEELDREIRRVIKEMYHLPESVSDGLIYCRKRDGGLGVPRVIDVVRGARLKAVAGLRETDGEVVRRLIVEKLDTATRKLATDVEVDWPVTDSSLAKWKRGRKKREFELWAVQKVQGKGVRCFRNNACGNAWLIKEQLQPGEEIDLLRMRSNVFPTREYIHRMNKEVEKKCRRCKEKDETLAHVLGECPAGRGGRIARHDKVVEELHRLAAERGEQVAREQLFRTDTEPLRPDLVVKVPGKAIIVDVTVRFENGEALKDGYREKESKYNRIIPAVCQDMGVEDAIVLPVVIGARGGMINETMRS